MAARSRPLLLASILLLVAPLIAIEGRAQVAYRSHASAGIASTANTSITHINAGTTANTSPPLSCAQTIAPSTPAGLVNDLLIALVVSKDSGATTLQASTGWSTLFSDDNPTGVSYQARIYWRIADGGASDNLTVSRANAAAAGCDVLIGKVARFRGVNTANPFQSGSPVPATNWTYSNSTVVTSGTESTLVPAPTGNAMLLLAMLIGDDDAVATPAGFTQSFGVATSQGTDAALHLKYALAPAAGVYGPFSQNKGGTDPQHGVLIALRPAASVVEGLTINRPTTPAAVGANDLMVASIAVRPSTIFITPPAGWTEVRNMTQSASTPSRMATYFRKVTDPSLEPASYQFVLAGAASTGAAGGIIAFSGVNTAQLPPQAAAPTEEGGNTTASALTHTVNQITTTIASSMLVGSFEFTSTPTAANWASNMTTERVDQGSIAAPDNNGIRLLMAHETRVAIGATGTRTATASGVSSHAGLAFLLALRPSSTQHFQITGPSGSTFATCEPAVVRITAHNSTHGVVNPPAGTTLIIRTSTGTGVWQPFSAGSGDLGTGANFLTSGADNGQATYTWSGTESVLQVRLRNNTATSSPHLSVNLNQPGGAPQEDATEDQTFTFADSVMRVTADGASSANLGTQIAGKQSNQGFGTQTLFVQGVASAPATGTCTTLFRNQTINVDFAAVCESPTTCSGVAGTEAAVRNNLGTFVTVAKNNGPGAPSTYTAVPLAFSNDANAMATFAVRYGDAGRIRIYMRTPLPSPATTYVSGSSNSFVVRPFGFAFPSVQHGVTETSALFPAAAGDNFSMTVSAYRWVSAEDDGTGNPRTDLTINLTDNGVTPNFAAATTVDVLPGSNLPGVADGAITRQSTGDGSVATGEFASGAAAITDWRYSEAGNVTFRAQSTNYLGSGASVTGRSTMDGTGNRVGRFRPKDFAISGSPTLTNRSALACAPASNFTYMNEGLGLSFMLVARNAQGATTQNYNGVYAKLGIGTFANFNVGAKSGATNLTTRVDNSVSPTGTWANGVASVSMSTGIRRATPDTPDGPYSTVQFGIAPVDTDGVAMNALDFDADGNSVNERKNLGVTTAVRFGQLAMSNRNGSQLRPLRVPVEAQYWNGTSFITNVNDSCTALAANNVALGNYQPNLNACETSVTAGAFAQGRSTIELSAPGPGNNGSVDLTANLSAANAGSTCIAGAATPVLGANRLYLQGKWTGTTYTQNPVSRATFGTYPGSDEVILLKEKF